MPLISLFLDEREVWSDDDDKVDGLHANNLPLAVNESPPNSPCEASTHTVSSVFTQWCRFKPTFSLLIALLMLFSILVLGQSYAPVASVGTDLPSTFYMDKKSYSGLWHTKVQKMPVRKHCGAVWLSVFKVKVCKLNLSYAQP